MKREWYATASSELGTVHAVDGSVIVPHDPRGANEATFENANLIAAAPDLLEALQGCLAALNAAIDHSDGDVFGIHRNAAMDSMDAASAAIAKATAE